MLTPEETKFLNYWQQERLRKKDFLKKFSIGLPVLALLAILFLVNFVSGWYDRANAELRQHSSLVIVILVAMIAIVVFIVIFSARYRWDRNEQEYQGLLKKSNDMQ